MYTRLIGKGSRWLLTKIVRGLAATGLHPNFLTLLGLVVTIWAAVLFAAGEFRWAAAVVFLAGFLDMADGPVARKQGRVSTFGAFFDSVVDRYSDMILYMGLLVYYAMIGRFFYVVLAAVAMAGSFMVSSQGLISTTSPIGQALLGKQAGEAVSVRTPAGAREFEVVRLLTIYDR